MKYRPILLIALPLFVSSVAACSSKGDTVAVTSTANKCTVADTSLAAGKLTFEVTNKGDEPTELYVLGENDRVIGEVENVGPGTSRTLTADLKAGDYTLVCKPGQTGDGIRQEIEVTGSGGKDDAEGETSYDRELEFVGTEYTFDAPTLDIKKGETIELKLENAGKLDHELEIIGPDGKAIGEVGPTKPGKTGEVILSFDEAGDYTYVCGIDDHEDRGMKGAFEVS